MSAFRNRLAMMASSLDPHFAQLLSRTAVAFALRAVGAVLAFALNVVIGRTLGAEGAGLYFFALSIVTIVSVVTRLGLDNSLLRFIASAVAMKDWARAEGVRQLGIRVATATSMIAGIFLIFCSPIISDQMIGQPDLAPVLRIMAIATAGIALMFLWTECLKGINRIAPAVTISSIILPSVALILVVPFSQRYGPTGAAWAYVAGATLAAIVGMALWRRYTTGFEPATPSFDPAELWNSCRHLWLMSIITKAVLPWSPLLILGFFATAQDVGIFGAATRIAMLVSFLLVSVNTVVSPKFAELFAKDDLQGLARIARRFALLITLATSPVILAMVLYGDLAMSSFGPEFVRGGTALAILAAGQAVNALTGSAGAILMMTGHEREIRNASFVTGALAISLSFALIPSYNLVGAAIAMALPVAAMNLISIAMIKNKLGIFVLPWGWR